MVIWDVTFCCIVDRYYFLRETYYILLYVTPTLKLEAIYVCEKLVFLFIKLQGVTQSLNKGNAEPK
jgi:hypothetical protein